MKRCDGHRVGQRVPAALLAAPDGYIERRTQNDVVERCRYFPEWFQEPRSDDPVHNDEIAATCVGCGHFRQHIDDDGVLLVSFRQIGWDRPVLDEMPEVVAVKMDLRRSGLCGERLRCVVFPEPGGPVRTRISLSRFMARSCSTMLRASQRQDGGEGCSPAKNEAPRSDRRGLRRRCCSVEGRLGRLRRFANERLFFHGIGVVAVNVG